MQESFIARFLKQESVGGIILFVMALAALALSNSPWADFYQKTRQFQLGFHFGDMVLVKPLLFWVNEGLMSLFFLIVGLELKREIVEGKLANISQVVLPGIAALGGMLVPVLIYVCLNYHNAVALQGWAVPVATDIAFALGVLSLFGKRVPVELKLFLMTLAVFDDVGAIVIVAIVHTTSLSYLSMFMALLLILLLQMVRACGVKRLFPYLLIGVLLWACVLKSGVHSTVAGVLLALMIPSGKKTKEKLSPSKRLEDFLHPWVTYCIMPLFAFANAGLSLSSYTSWSQIDSVVIGTALGLFLGKQLGVFSSAWLVIRLGWAKRPSHTPWLAFYGVTILCGIGFTMSLFLGTLAFQETSATYLMSVRLGVLLGSLLSGLIGAAILQIAFSKKAAVKEK